ncbi:MAG: hypothetical protein A2Y56_10080 [Candidatus Aminicenantes bacterium RBG_13_63_10]|nr:MAG: hypothetical protein A2Y56_10080 [Candidatus Aminicenantes bacterium RBG_13_63_10]
MKSKKGFCFAALFLLAGFSLLIAQTDAEGCKDHPLFTRMPNHYIEDCEASDFDSHEFYLDEAGNTTVVEGAKTYLNYSLVEGSPAPSALQILRNYINAAQKIGGKVIYQDRWNAYLKIVREGSEFWVDVRAFDGGGYRLTIIEKKALVQEVTANDILDALDSQGFIALDIRFDTGKATIKEESKPVIDQIAAALRENADLKVSVEGHTDNTGTPEGNKTLSMKRAEAVVAALVQAGIAAGRLSAVGWGQEKPVADNRTEEGRAKNRRVEVVKK